MPTLSSRAPVAPTGRTKQEVMEAAQPAFKILNWLSTVMYFPDDSPPVIMGLHQIVEDAIECLNIADYSVVSMPSVNPKTLEFDVAVKPFEDSYFVAFRVQFKVL